MRSSSSSLQSDRNVEFEEGWAHIQKRAIEPLESYLISENRQSNPIKQLFTAGEYSSIYSLIYDMCTQSPRNWSKQLFSKYCETIERFLREKVVTRLKKTPEPELLLEFQLAWSNYSIYTHWMERFFGYLNKYHLKISGEGSLKLKAMSIFYETVFLEVKNNLSYSFSNSLQNYRLGSRVIREETFKETVNICLEMSKLSNIQDIYENEIENLILNRLSLHYESLAPNWVINDTLTEYLLRVEQIINDEKTLCELCLANSSWRKIEKSLKHILVAKEIETLLSRSDSMAIMFANNDFNQLKLLYFLFSSTTSGSEALSAQFKRYLLNSGRLIINRFSELINWNGSPRVESYENFRYGEIIVEIPSSVQEVLYGWPWIPEKAVITPFFKNSLELLFIQVMISLYDHSLFLLENCFNRDTLVQRAIKESLEVIVNQDVGSKNQATLFCGYCDFLIRKDCWTDQKMPIFEQEDKFKSLATKIVDMLSYIRYQDYFLQIYKFKLANRLLRYHSSLLESEQLIISQLKNKCGASFTSKLEGMIADIQASMTINSRFKEYLNLVISGEAENIEFRPENYQETEICSPITKSKLSTMVEFSVNVITCSNWPTLTLSNLCLPASLQSYIDEFETFYSLETSHRKLSWVHWYGQCVLDFKYPGSNGSFRCTEIYCNTYQACILLLFNNLDRFSLHELEDLLKTDKPTLLEHIKPLYIDSSILKVTNGSQCTTGNLVFELNDKFIQDNCTTSILIASPNQAETTLENNIDDDRSYAIEAAIVKVMKVRGEMTQNEIISHVSSQFGDYKPASGLIIDKISNLVEREYLSSHQQEPDKFLYLI
ncbi:Cullin-1 [Cryptosporidium felis]|nr:Cullin-1 [Cryptosporidium felis]